MGHLFLVTTATYLLYLSTYSTYLLIIISVQSGVSLFCHFTHPLHVIRNKGRKKGGEGRGCLMKQGKMKKE